MLASGLFNFPASGLKMCGFCLSADMLALHVQHWRLNVTYPMTKPQLMDAAENSGISRAPIKGGSGVVGEARPGAKPQFEHNGWSSFKTLKNSEPPYVIAYSNPVKVKLTPEVQTFLCTGVVTCLPPLGCKCIRCRVARFLPQSCLPACSWSC